MKQTRKKHSAAFKAKVAVAATSDKYPLQRVSRVQNLTHWARTRVVAKLF